MGSWQTDQSGSTTGYKSGPGNQIGQSYGPVFNGYNTLMDSGVPGKSANTTGTDFVAKVVPAAASMYFGGAGGDTGTASTATDTVSSYANVADAWEGAGMNNATPSMSDLYSRYSAGGKDSIFNAYDNMKAGNYPEVAGYVSNKLPSFSAMAPPPVQPAAMNINYQQPEDQYAALYKRYRR